MTKNLKSQLLSKKAAKALLAASDWRVDEKFSIEISKLLKSNDHLIYTHPDGRIFDLFTNEEKGRLYISHEDFERLLARLEEIREGNNLGISQHVLMGRLPYENDFIEYIPQLITDLAIKLKIPPEMLDRSVDSLIKVDAAIRKYGKAKSLEAPIFPMLVAYVGEVMRQEIEGRWEMRLSEIDKEIWEPWIIDSRGRSCNPFLGVYDELAEQIPFSIYGSTLSRINQRRIQTQVGGNVSTIVYHPKPISEE